MLFIEYFIYACKLYYIQVDLNIPLAWMYLSNEYARINEPTLTRKIRQNLVDFETYDNKI